MHEPGEESKNVGIQGNRNWAAVWHTSWPLTSSLHILAPNQTFTGTSYGGPPLPKLEITAHAGTCLTLQQCHQINMGYWTSHSTFWVTFYATMKWRSLISLNSKEIFLSGNEENESKHFFKWKLVFIMNLINIWIFNFYNTDNLFLPLFLIFFYNYIFTLP